VKPATSNLAYSWGCSGPSSNPTRRKCNCGPGLEELSEIWGFPFNISATAEARDFKFGTQLGFSKPIIKSHAEERVGVALSRGAPQYLGVSLQYLHND